MATKDSKDGLRDILDKLETPAVRWALVAIGVVILVRLRLILFAAALPVMAYWHYSNHSEEPAEASAGTNEDDEPAPQHKDSRDDDEFGSGGFGGPSSKDNDEEVYDKSFWASDGPAPEQAAPRSAPSREAAPRLDDDDDDFGFGDAVKKDKPSWDDDPSGGPVDDFPSSKGRSNMDDILGSLGSLGPLGGGDDDFGLGKSGGMDFDFLGGGGGMDDMDFLSGGFGGGGGKGKGKGKGKKGDKGGFRDGGEKGEKGPREPNPKQVFVAGVGDTAEEEIRMFFEDVGEVDRLKVLTTPEGDSKGVCFVTFRTEEQAQKALGLHGSDLGGRNITVRLAHGGGKGKEDGGGGGKGGGKDFGKRDRLPDSGPSERFGSAFGDDRGERSFGGDRPKGGGKGGGKGRGRNERSELDELLEEALADQDGPVKVADFDFAARRFLAELRSRDRSDGTQRFNEALDMVFKYTSSKDRSSVRKWPAYIFTLLQKFDPQLTEDLRGRDAARRAEKGGGGGGGFSRPPRDARPDDDDDRD